ncbi:MAG: SGNH/GDSL hydrolase family protein [Acidocella sp.]|nr:SGNH/GDSL hydrolase family protein [Acidocella sp.]
MKRLNLFVKGNVDVHDSLHSCVIGGVVRWNGINEVLRELHPGMLARIKHETWTRSDALLAADGAVPAELAARSFKLGPYPLTSQFSLALFETTADAIILTVQPDMATRLLRHRASGQLFYPYEMAALAPEDRVWLAAHYEPDELLTVEQSVANFETIITRVRERNDAPILIYNVSAAIPGETVHCLQGLGETFTTRARRFTLGLAELSEKTGISVIDVDSLLARSGVDRVKLNALHVTPEGYELVAREVVRVLDDLGLIRAPAH